VLLHRGGAVNAGIIEHQHRGASQGLAKLVDGLGEELAGPGRFTHQAREMGRGSRPPRLPKAEQRIAAGSALGGEFDRWLPASLPGVRHRCLPRHSALIYIIDSYLLICLCLVQQGQLVLKEAKEQRIPPGA